MTVLCQEGPIQYDRFVKELQECLVRMFDPEYQPPEAFCQVLGCAPAEGSAAVRRKIQQAIAQLEPGVDTTQSTIPRLVYEILHKRYCLKLTQEETAYRINVSRRTINRFQRVAVQTVSGLLWEQAQAAHAMEEKPAPVQAMDWNTQFQQELSHLETAAPKAHSNISEVLTDALSILNAPKMDSEIQVQVSSIQPDLVAAVHPVLLEQVLISALKRLAAATNSKEITIFARLEDGNARITLSCACGDVSWDENALIQAIPTSNDIRIEIGRDNQQVFLWIVMPSEGKLTVLVVDDNEDLVQFYRDCTIGTRYQILHLAQGATLFRAVREVRPEIIILDVMLPDIDGWRLLMRLHEDKETREIPVLVCSVIREEELALSLGAAGFLAKPVSPRLFISALDRVQPPVGAKGPTTPASSAESD